ncbi:MAG: MarR family transcriptional regulator [Chloroflexi bacterium]|nr:MarR family transcriptional regulator [Chloroflexota bacterium]
MNKCDGSHTANPQSFEEEFFLLLMRINRVLRQLANQQMEVCRLTPTQLFFLKRLYEAGAPQPISFFADGVFSNRSNASQMIDRLQAEGYVERVKNPKDRRSVLVQLTDSGAEELELGHARHQQLAQSLFEPFSEEERDAAIRTLRHVLSLLEAYETDGSEGLEDAQANSA